MLMFGENNVFNFSGTNGKKLKISEDFEDNAHPSIEEVVAKYAGVKPDLQTTAKHSAGRKFFKVKNRG